MFESPRWLFLREIFPAFDGLIIMLEKMFRSIGRIFFSGKDYASGISLAKLPRNLLYGIFIIFLGYFAAFSIIWKLDNPGIRVVPILTGSMEPNISTGSLIVTSPFDKYHVGDVITYRETHPKTGEYTDRTLTHRIIAKKDTEEEVVYIAQGDANRVPDINDIKKDDVHGKVLYSIPFAGYLYALMSTIPGFLILIAVPAVLLIKNEIRYIRYNKIMDSLRKESEDLSGMVLER